HLLAGAGELGGEATEEALGPGGIALAARARGGLEEHRRVLDGGRVARRFVGRLHRRRLGAAGRRGLGGWGRWFGRALRGWGGGARPAGAAPPSRPRVRRTSADAATPPDPSTTRSTTAARVATGARAGARLRSTRSAGVAQLCEASTCATARAPIS